jgi:hypothetical protein
MIVHDSPILRHWDPKTQLTPAGIVNSKCRQRGPIRFCCEVAGGVFGGARSAQFLDVFKALMQFPETVAK